MKKLLKGRLQESFEFSSSISRLETLSNKETAVVVLYFHRKEISDSALKALESFVESGGGLLALHSASASFKQNNRYFKLLGGRFTNHGRISSFKVEPESDQGEIFQNITGFETRDELYIHQYTEDITVHFSTETDDHREPVVWTRKLSKGKIVYFSLGHCASVWKHPNVKSIMYQGLDWLEGIK
ncbi:ThuA domain-containing protein [bacterium]|nr:ThuA domain-containing protein [bacterium]